MRDGVSTGQHQQDDRDDEVKKLRDELISAAVKHTTAGCRMKLWPTCTHVCRHVSCQHLMTSLFQNTLTVNVKHV